MAATDNGSQPAGQEEEVKCYCGKDRSPSEAEFQCAMCSRFYHGACLNCEKSDFVPYMTNYQFFCKRCNASGQDNFTKKPASFTQKCHTAIANLMQQNPGRKYFSKEREIIPFIEKNWENLTTTPRRIKQTWHSTITKTLTKDLDLFTSSVEEGEQMFGLVMDELPKIGPNCEALFRLIGGGVFQPTTYKSAPKASAVEAKTTRGTKRKATQAGDSSQGSGRNKKGEVSTSAKITPLCYPLEHPYNKDGYRYILAEPDPHAPNWEAFDQSMEWAGKPIPGYLYRRYIETSILLSLNDRAPQMKLGDDRLSAFGDKGYSMVRATHGVNHGAWFFEVTIEDMPSETACRIGWSQPLGNLQAPCGYDKFSYSWRSIKGTKFHESRGKHYTDGGYGQGDVLGFYIFLPEPHDPDVKFPDTYKDKPLVRFKNLFYYEEKDQVNDAERKLKPLKGSKMMMFKNGECKGVAFQDVYEGFYFPAISVYKNATIKVNFGPDFKKAPSGILYRPMSQAVDEHISLSTMADMIYHITHEGQLPEF